MSHDNKDAIQTETVSVTIKRPQFHDLRTEGRGLVRVFIPMPGNNDTRKFVTFFLVLAWCIITIGLALEPIPTVRPPYYGFYTALVFTIVGRSWEIEVDTLLGNN